MTITPDVSAAIEAARHEAHIVLDRSFDLLRERLTPPPAASAGSISYKTPTDEDCRDQRNKNGLNLSPEGLEILFRLLDGGAGYNSAGRRMSITQTAVKNRKKDWEAAGGLNRPKMFIPYLDTIV
ncbi:hypothetical protein [Rhizobium leguminosarum]|uniref:hypothetical protein n=1 Tax=Rhizobium leguminosarum TaxID=384 RepID=UPI003F9944D7